METNRLEAITKPQEEPDEYLSEKLNVEDLWKAAFPLGTEWHRIDVVYEFNWDFKNLEQALEEGGMLYGKKNVYIFCIVEPQSLHVYKDAKPKIVHVPTLVAVESPFPPPDKIAITSFTSILLIDEIIPMKQMNMDWIPFGKRIFVLGCTQTREQLSHIKNLQYWLPYFYQPVKKDELKQSTLVDISFPSEPPVVCVFDWDKDELEEYVKNLIQEEALSAEQKDEFKQFVKDLIRKKKVDQVAECARKKLMEEMSEVTMKVCQSMKFYKFYPQPSLDVPTFKKRPHINRYYVNVHQVL